jgi:hypothetical protein
MDHQLLHFLYCIEVRILSKDTWSRNMEACGGITIMLPPRLKILNVVIRSGTKTCMAYLETTSLGTRHPTYSNLLANIFQCVFFKLNFAIVKQRIQNIYGLINHLSIQISNMESNSSHSRRNTG